MRAKLQVNFDPLFWYENKAKVIPPPCDSTSGNLIKTSVKEKSRLRCLSANRLSFSELFDDIPLRLSVRRLCMVVDDCD